MDEMDKRFMKAQADKMDREIMGENILQEADRITGADRNRAYGHPSLNLTNIAEFWDAYIFRRFGVRLGLGGRDVSMMMVLEQISRDANARKRDNLVDIAGWARTAEMLEEEPLTALSEGSSG